MIDPPNVKPKAAAWWRLDQGAMTRTLEGGLGSELSWLETRAVVWSSIRAIKAGGPNARAAQEALRILGPEMRADGARVIADLWLAGKLRDRGPGYGSCVFMELPDSGAAFVDEVIGEVQKDPSLLEREPYIVEWVLTQRGTIAEIVGPLDTVLSNVDVRKAGNFYLQLGTLPFTSEDAARTARMFRFETKMGNMQLSTTLPQSGAAGRFVADYREALTETAGSRVSSALEGVARAGSSLRELRPEVEALLEGPDEGVRFQAKVAMAMISGRPADVEAEVFDVVENQAWRSGGSTVSGGRVSQTEVIADLRQRVSVAALCSGAWPSDIASEKLIVAVKFIEPNALMAMQQQGLQFILKNAEQTRKHADALNDAIAKNQIVARIVGRRVRMYPAADAIASGLERAAEASSSQFQRRVLRGQAAEARRKGRTAANP